MSDPVGMRTYDISEEEWREYVTMAGMIYRIYNPVTLYTKEGSPLHRVVDADGVAHLCPGWRTGAVIRWKTRKGAPPVRF